jgi:hypothetical protein
MFRIDRNVTPGPASESDRAAAARRSSGLAVGLGAGIAIGAGLGVALGNLALGVGLGAALGMAFSAGAARK